MKKKCWKLRPSWKGPSVNVKKLMSYLYRIKVDLTNISSPPYIQVPGPSILHVTPICIESANVLTFGD